MSVRRAVPVLLAFFALTAACGGGEEGIDQASGTPDPLVTEVPGSCSPYSCVPGDRICGGPAGQTIYHCVADDPGCGNWIEFEVCPTSHTCVNFVDCQDGECVETPWPTEDHDQDGYAIAQGPCGAEGAGMDCDDNDPLVHPGAWDVCNQKDDDCDGETDEDCGTPDCEDSLGVAYCPCKDSFDCMSGFCIETMEDWLCTDMCFEDESCPPGWKCALVWGNLDPVFICVDRNITLCRPCKSDDDCTNPYLEAQNLCIDHGPQGSFCGTACTGDGDCPQDYRCQETGGRRSSEMQCMPQDGTDCPCYGKNVAAGYLTFCAIENEFGICSGERMCHTACDAQVPEYEMCNGLDDDCNGQTDEGFPDINLNGICDLLEPKDCDDDGILDADDNCECTPNPAQADCDNDGMGDACDPCNSCDDVPDADDNCPCVINPAQEDLDSDGIGDACDCDMDDDGVANANPGCPDPTPEDNCYEDFNPDQWDTDCDCYGDACDDDDDNDGVKEEHDNCPMTYNPSQNDMDGDGLGDACDPDVDGDVIPNPNLFYPDPCAGIPDYISPNVDDLDGDGTSDACDWDDDGDGLADTLDNCPRIANPDQTDSNANMWGDACEECGCGCGDLEDNCPFAINNGQEDQDLDGQGDMCDPDVDGDQVPNDQDNCPMAPNPTQWDCDEDGIGEACEACVDCDDDGDCEETDCDPGNPNVFHGAVEVCNDVDDDCDGQTDEADASGCTEYYQDQDLDGWGGEKKMCLCVPAATYTATQAGDCDDLDDQVTDCDDGDPCTTDGCDPTTDECTHGPKDCDDGSDCTIDSCSPVTGWCEHEYGGCDDDNGCTKDWCDADAGECVNDPILDCDPCHEDPECNDGNPCTKDWCQMGRCLQKPVGDCDCFESKLDPDTCECVVKKKHCDDGKWWTWNICNPATGECQHPARCEYPPTVCCECGGNGCTIECNELDTGMMTNFYKGCDDGDVCTMDGCTPLTGECTFTPLNCEDGDSCTVGSCNPSTGMCEFEPVTCDDGVDCTVDTCDPDSGTCVHAIASCPDCVDDADCNDDNICTQDGCVEGYCINSSVDCDDGDCLTEDSCDLDTGECVHVSIEIPCP